MTKLNRVFVLVSVAALALVPSVASTNSLSTLRSTVPYGDTLRGELVKVDTDSMTLAVKAADGIEYTFRYNEQTEVSGGLEGVAGLATKSGSSVIVHYTGEKENRTATKIEVLPKS